MQGKTSKSEEEPALSGNELSLDINHAIFHDKGGASVVGEKWQGGERGDKWGDRSRSSDEGWRAGGQRGGGMQVLTGGGHGRRMGRQGVE